MNLLSPAMVLRALVSRAGARQRSRNRILILQACATVFALLPAARAQGTNGDLNRAQALLAAGKYSEAAAAFTGVIAEAPNSSPAFHGRGMARINLNDYAGAILDFDRAVALDPKDAIGYNERGYAKMRSGDQNGALADYARCIQVDPTYVPVHTNRGLLYQGAGNNQAAVENFNRALEMAPGNERARALRGVLKMALGDFGGARTDFSVVVELNPKSAAARYNRGLALEKLGDRAGALADYQTALALNPSMTVARNHVAGLQASVVAAAGNSAKNVKAAPPTAPVNEVVALAPPPPPGSPSLSMPASLDIDLVSGTQYAGEVAAAKEAMSALQGPLSDADQKDFEKKWAPFFNFPAPETADYFKKLNPLLQEYLHLRASVPGITTEMSAAWQEAVMLAGYRNEAAVREALGEARVQEQLLQGVNGRMAEIMRQVQALGDPPDAREAKARVRKHHDDALALVKKVLPAFTISPASQSHAPGTACSFSPQVNKLPEDAIVRWNFGDGKKADTPVQAMAHAYAKAGEFKVTAQLLDGRTKAVIATATAFANIKALPEAAAKGEWDLQKVDRQMVNGGLYNQEGKGGFEFRMNHVSSAETLQTQIHLDPDTSGDPPYGGGDVTFTVSHVPLPRTISSGGVFKMAADFAFSVKSAITGWVTNVTEQLGKYSVGMYSSLPTGMAFRPDPQHGNLSWLIGVSPDPNYAKNWPERLPIAEGSHTYKLESPINPFPAVPVGKLGQVWLIRVETKVSVFEPMGYPPCPTLIETYTYVFQPEGTAPAEVAVDEHAAEESANQQRISELENEVKFIDESISKLQAQRGKARDLASIQSVDYQIMQAQTDRLAEMDLIASLKTGQDVHTRSPFDEYARQTFVANIKEQQLRMEEAQRETAALFKYAELGDDRDGMRDQIQRDLIASGAVARGDIAAIRKMANAMNNRVVGYWEGQKARSEEAAIDADENIFICNTFVMASTMLVSGGMSQLGAVCAAPTWAGTVGTMTYAGVTGYIASGSPAEALKQSVAWSCTVGQVATSMYDGYQDGGGWKGALTGAGTGLAIGWLTGKTSELIVAKWGTGPSFVRPPVRDRPPSVGDFLNSAEFRQAQATGKAKVKAFEDAQAQLQVAGRGGADPERIRALQDAVKTRANDINADQHAKMFLLKSGQGSPASVRAYESYHRAIHADVEARFHDVMEQEMGFNHQEVAPVRNATSTGSAGMDYDLALKEGSPILRNGKPSSVSEWQKNAKEAYDKAFQEVTGHSAEKAWENVTTGVHAESYKDIGNTPGVFEGWLTDLRNPENVKALKSKYAQQATDVTRVKAWEFQNNKTMDEFSKMQEICRGTAKDMKTKLDPVLSVAKTSSLADEETLRQTRAYWKQVQEVMEDFGSNRIGPITAKQKLYQLTGKESIHEVIDEMGVTMQGAVQWGR